jgi:HD-like signal output (HDOD) protein
MNNLPALSANVTKVMTLLRDDSAKMESIVEALEKDVSLVAEILKLVNSGFYGLRNTVETVEHAVSLLGIMNLKQVVYSATIMDFFSKDEQQEWNHSYSSSILCSNIKGQRIGRVKQIFLRHANA